MAKKRAKSYHLAILALIMALGVATPSVVYLITVGNAALASEQTETTPETGGSDSTSEGGDATEETEGEGSETEDGLGELKEGEVRPADTEEFQAALSNAIAGKNVSLITLTQDIKGSANFVFDRPTDQPLVLDLNNHNIEVDSEGARVLDIYRGNLEITGTGTIYASNSDGIAIRVYGSDDSNVTNNTTLTIRRDVTLRATSTSYAYGLFVSHKNNHAYGVNIDFKGEIDGFNGITVNGNIQDQTNAPVIKLDGARIQTQTRGTAVYAAGYADWQINGTHISADTGIGMKAGKFVLDGDTRITANGEKTAVTPGNDGIDESGAVFQIEDNAGVYAGNIEITINNGNYHSNYGDVFYEYGAVAREANPSALKSLTINSGSFSAGAGKVIEGLDPESVSLKGGSYNPKVDAAYLTSSQEFVFVNGSWEIRNTTTPTPGGDDGKDDPTNPDDGDKDDQKPDDSTKPSVPGGSLPNTGLNNEIYSPRVVSAVKSAAAAIIAGILVVAALLLHRFTSRHHLEEEPKAAGRGRGIKTTSEAKASKPTKSRVASKSSTRTVATRSKSAKVSTKSASTTSRSTGSRAKSAKTSAKSKR